MRYLLDTNICIYLLKGMHGIDAKIKSIDIDDLAVSAITIAELLYGAYNSNSIEKNLSKVKSIEETLTVFGLDRECIELYAKIKARLRSEGQILDDFDILIAAIAIESDSTIVTNNTKHFERIEGIKLENWVS